MHGTRSKFIRNLKGIGLAVAIGAMAATLSIPAAAQSSTGEHVGDDLTETEINAIIEQFAAKEAAFARARENYTYRQTARIQELDAGGNVTGRWEMIADVIFDEGGERTERVVRAPVPTLDRIVLTPEDLEDLKNVQPFVLTTSELPDYHIRYVGRETLDEIPTYTFAVRPKKMEEGKRYFAGLVWVDDLDLQIVKTYGRGVGIVKEGNVFPKFETYRQPIDGQYWFPTYTIAESILHFPDFDQPLRQVVKYEDYKQFKSDVSISFDLPEGEVIEEPSEEQPEPQQ